MSRVLSPKPRPSGAPRVCHVTTVHRRDDVRIALKECGSIAAAGYQTFLVVADGLGEEAARGMRIVDAGERKKSRLLRFTWTVWAVYRQAVRIQADLYHVHDPELLAAAVLLAWRRRRVIYDVHEDFAAALRDRDWMPRPLRWIASRLFLRWQRLACRRLDAIVVATPSIGRVFAPREATLVQNYPIATELEAASATPYASRPRDVLYVGAMTEVRGTLDMVRAMGLSTTPTDARLVLLGRFARSRDLDDARKLPGWSRVVYAGHCSREQVAAHASRARAGLVPFRRAWNHIHAQPTKLYEYLSAGIPVIASDFPLWRSLLERGPCGIVAEPGSPEAISRAIAWILSHPREAEEMGSQGRKLVESEYNWSRESRALLRLYEDLF